MKKKLIILLLASSLALIPSNSFGAWTTSSSNGNTANTGNINQNFNPNQSTSAYFNDISNHWARAYIETWSANGIFGGMGDGSFCPDDFLTREQFATALNRLFSLQMVTEENYKDYNLPSDARATTWSKESIAVCLDNGVMNLRNGNFAPTEAITREEVFYSLGKAMSIESLITAGSLSRFSDGNLVSSVAREVISKMASSGILNGRDGITLAPLDNITRAEVSTILSKSVTFYNDKNIKNLNESDTVVINVPNKNGSLNLSKGKVNGNLFITGTSINELTLSDLNVKGKIFIQAKTIDSISIENTSDLEFVIIAQDINFTDINESEDNIFNIINPITVTFDGTADELSIEGNYIENIEINSDKINYLSITSNNDDINTEIELLGSIETMDISTDATITGDKNTYIKTLNIRDYNINTNIVGETTKIYTKKVSINGTEYDKGTYDKSDIKSAVNSNSNNSNNTIPTKLDILIPQTISHNKGNPFNTKFTIFDYKLKDIYIDNSLLLPEYYYIDYTTKSLSLYSNFINSLSYGVHTFKVNFENNYYDTFSINIANETQYTSFTFDKAGGIYNRDILISSIDSAPTSIYFNNNIVSSNYYSYNNNLKELTFLKNYLSNLNTGIYNVTINMNTGMRKIVINVTQSSNGTSITFDKNITSSDYKDIEIYGTVNTSDLNVYVGNTSLVPNQYIYESGKVTILRSTFAILPTGTYNIRVTSTSGTIEATINIINTSSNNTLLWSKQNASSLSIITPYNGIVSRVTLGNNILPTSSYQVSTDGTQIILPYEYLRELSNSTYSLNILYSNSQSSTFSVIITD